MRIKPCLLNFILVQCQSSKLSQNLENLDKVLTIVFKANNIAAYHKVAILLSYIEGKTYDLLRYLLGAKLPLE